MSEKTKSSLSPWPFLIIYTLPICVMTGYWRGGLWHFQTLLIVFGLVPLIDWMLGLRTDNPSPEEEDELVERRAFRWITWLVVPVQVAVVFYGAYVAGSGALGPAGFIGAVISVGIMTGAVGINVSHELVHRPNKWERFLGKTLLWTVFYTHWAVEHVFGHHRYVATPRDPATSRLGESVYAFLPRSIIGGFASAWRIEAARLTRLKLRTWHPRNQILQGLALQIGLAAFFGVVFGPLAIVYYLAQSLVGVSLLEVVNYIEHYGLARREIAEGRFEQVTPLHSWNASHVVTNYFLFHLQRHSDHHAAPLRRYQILRHFDESPQLPAGYAAMVVIALIPPLWYRLMNPRVHDHRAKLAATEAAA